MKNKGFTLIEIIIVIVILGILATLSLPRLTGQIDAAEAGEAMQTFGMVKRAALDCYDSTSTMVSCDTATELTLTLPTPSKFNYRKTSTATQLIVTARATKNTANLVSLRVSSDGVTNFSATGPFVGIVNKTGASAAITAANSAAANAF